MAHIFILHGNDSEALDGAVDALIREQRESGMADMNLSLLSGKGMSAEAFMNETLAAPFLTDKRVVILTEPLAMAGGREGNQRFLKQLDAIPPTTFIYLVIPDAIERKDWETLSKSNFLRKWADKNPDRVKLTTYSLPSQSQMSPWIMKKATEKGGQFDPSGASALAAAVGNDTRRAAREIDKLLLYVDYARPVDGDDVNELVTGAVPVSVFDMVDAMAVGNAKVALAKMHRLLEEQELPQLFAMIARQFRLLIQTREILDHQGSSAQVQKELGQVPFVADKLTRQARAFSAENLRTIYRSLLELDYGFKSSRGDPLSSMDLFIIDVAKQLNKGKI